MHRLGKGIRHFKETEEGRDHMSEAVEKYGDKREKRGEKNNKILSVKTLMTNMKWSIDQALDALSITEQKERQSIIKAVQRGC